MQDANVDRFDIHEELQEVIHNSLSAKLKGRLGRDLRHALDEDSLAWGSGGRADHGREDEICFWFSDELPTVFQDLAIHVYDVIFALDFRPLDKIVQARGSRLDPAHHNIERVIGMGPHRPFFLWPERRQTCRNTHRWHADLATTELPKLGNTLPHHFAHMDDSIHLTIRTAAMTGWCYCPLCKVARSRRRLPNAVPSPSVVDAWKELSEQPLGASLARRAALELETSEAWTSPGCAVLADWLSERKVQVDGAMIPGLAWTFAR
jgi:hypothetical protein